MTTPILDTELGEALKQEGMANVEEGAGAEFRDLALDAVFRVASFRKEFVSDDVWVALDGQAAGRADNRALGPVMRRAQGLGWIAPTGMFVLTAQARRHRSPVRVWRSLIAEVQ